MTGRLFFSDCRFWDVLELMELMGFPEYAGWHTLLFVKMLSSGFGISNMR